MKKNKFGFTLLEMLVVIGIIAILVSMGFVSYSSAQKKARDAKRKLEMGAIRNAMEQYYSLCNSSYPVSNGGKVPGSITASTGDGCSADNSIMATVPTDPKTPTEEYNYDDTGPPPSICSTLMESESNPYCVFLQQ